MWEVWEWDGQCIQGKLHKAYKSKQSAIKYARKTIEYDKETPDSRNELFLEKEDGTPVGIIVKRKP